MQFGKVENPAEIEFVLPEDHLQTSKILNSKIKTDLQNINVGCAKWNRQDLKNFYPRGTKDELTYYSTQFNSVELNATFYRFFPKEQFETWAEKVESDFKFFPKVPRYISHIKRLKNVEEQTNEFIVSLLSLKEKLGMVFLQMPENFHVKNIDSLKSYIENWPKEIPLAVELRHTDWYTNPEIADNLNDFLIKKNVASIITDSAGRRDLLHMRLTNDTAFIRYVGANDESDFERLDDWVKRIKQWQKLGLKNLYFFVHQNIELQSPFLSAYFIEKLNKELNVNLKIPKTKSNEKS
ncbi:MAG TPA: DUF72 domain-containing protein [Salinimicrobium sp.]|nr:DUF72 domain-containing protein [Salinimicrobium sp.]